MKPPVDLPLDALAPSPALFSHASMLHGQAQSAAPLETVPVHGQVSLIGSVGATNVAVQVGAQGVLVVDTGAGVQAA